jgi:mRNA interferase RelE/StbE
MYEIILDKSAEKDLNKLSGEIIRRIVKVIDKLASEPRPPGVKKLKESDEDLYRVRTGDYRIVYAITDEIKIINIRRIGHRKDIYRYL